VGKTRVGFSFVNILVIAAAAGAAQAQTPAISQGGVVNSASYITPITPGTLVSIFGSNLATSTAQYDTIPLSSQLNQVSVTMNGIPAPLLYVSGQLINVQVPWGVISGATQGSANVVVTNDGQVSTGQSVQVGPFSPGLFAINNGTVAVAINSDGSIAAPAGSIPGVSTRPASIKDPIGLEIWCTGLGAVNASLPDGGIPASGQLVTANTFPAVLVGGQAATVLWAGLTPYFPGVNQINIQLAPGTPTGSAVPIQIVSGGITTSATITIAVQQ
jgi:uncharacterized protein (TIGR03437 family)